MESMLAAYGSGASKVSHDEDKRILNIDIGGGTTKLAVVEKGNVIATAAVHIGGRLQVVDEIGHIVRLDPAGQVSRPRGRLRLEPRRRALAAAARQGRREHGRRAGRRADQAPDAACDRASLSHRPDRAISAASTASCSPAASANTSTAAKQRDFGDMGRRLGQAIRRTRRCRRAAVAAAAGGRMHPRHRARRVRIQRAAHRQYQLHLQARRAAAAAQSAGAAAAVRLRRGDRSADSWRRRSARISPRST